MIGASLYYYISPIYSPPEMRKLVLIALGIITIIIPALLLILLRSTGRITSFNIEKVGQRKLPLYITLVVFYIAITKVIPQSRSYELYYFFVAMMGSTLGCLVFVFFKIKASIHMLAISGLTTFIIGLSIHYQTNLVLLIGVLVLLNGAIASSRLLLKAHSSTELILGMCIGSIPYFLPSPDWL